MQNRTKRSSIVLQKNRNLFYNFSAGNFVQVVEKRMITEQWQEVCHLRICRPFLGSFHQNKQGGTIIEEYHCTLLHHHMLNLLFIFWFLTTFSPAATEPVRQEIPSDSLACLYADCQLQEVLPLNTFRKLMGGVQQYGLKKPVISLADFSLPSDRKRFFVIDLKEKKLLYSTWVAHGKNSGMQIATQFSNKMKSYQSSPGFYRVGPRLQSPKHGLALQLIGLEKGVNDNAQKREIIMHGASYVGEDFIRRYGRCGRSFGCPALPVEMMPTLAPLLSDGSLLYIHTP